MGRKRKDPVGYDQAGYIGWSMSERAVQAYEGGAMPRSKWTKSALIDGVVEMGGSICCAAFTLDVLIKRCLTYDSWHHTSLYANPTNFYRVDAKAAAAMTEDAIRSELGDEKVDRIKEKATLEAVKRAEKRAEQDAFRAAHAWVPYHMLPEHRIEVVRITKRSKKRIVRVHSLDPSGNEIVSAEDFEIYLYNDKRGFLIPKSEIAGV